MKNIGRWLILAGSIVALSLSVFLGYWWVVERPAPPSMDRGKKPQKKPPKKLDVTLPQNLQKEMAREKERRNELYRQAIEYHRNGRIDSAVQRYQQAIALSKPDHTAAESYRLLGDIYSQSGSTRRAIRLYEYAVNIESDNPLYRYRLARAHERLGQFSEAATAYERALELQPKALYYLARGNLAFERGRYDRAIQYYESGLNQSKYRARLLVNLGRAHQELDQYDQALERYDMAQRHGLSTELGYRVASNRGHIRMSQGNVSRAVNAFEQAVSLQSTTEAYYNLGRARLEAGLWSGAVDALESAQEQSPEDVAVLTDLGYAYRQVGNYREAAAQYKRAIELNPDNNDLYFAVARLYERLNRPTQALIYYRELTNRLLPGKRLALVFRRVGELYMKTDHPDSAAPAFRNALKMDTGNPEITYNLGLSYRRTGQIDRSVEQFRRAHELDASDTHYHYVYAVSLYRAGFRKRARREFQALFERAPSRLRAGYMVGFIDYTWGRLERARNRFQGLLSNVEDPDLKAAIFRNLGNIYTRNEKYNRAITVFKQSLSIRENPATYYNMGIVYAEQGNWTQANSSFRYALQNGGDNGLYYAGLGLAMYERGIYEQAEQNLQRALELNSDITRARYDLRRVREAMAES